ncbi:hypothetical protein KC19_8G064100 [Ceratodon purpureus]|uniref:Peptidase A1 domain-containing protein n=1 Tax=Ceratodon purpureus TaxID=3225 RepID=A0A8T0GZ70_CERPU|nr:hypothetical protein KC19_8G064100 [Ceratodon purpureus]
MPTRSWRRIPSEHSIRTPTRAIRAPYQNSPFWLKQPWRMLLLLLLLFLGSVLCCAAPVTGRTTSGSAGGLYTFEVTHRFSDKAREELKARHGDAFLDWPRQGTPEFHDMLFHLDLHRHPGRVLPRGDAAKAKAPPLMASSVGNTTYFNQRDGLQYTYIEIGTPSQRFYVALDTGSDLLWLPCAHCVSCAPSVSTLYDTTFNVYDASNSSSSERVTCSSPYCVDVASACSSSTMQCPYHIQYISPVTTEGYLVEDVMYLIPQKGGNKTAADVVFGCGTNQTGEFQTGATVPDGLLGLGMRNISVPSILAQAKVMADSFSMCFDYGLGTGRLVLGDRGSPKAYSTPIITHVSPQFYWVGLSYVLVGGVSVKTMTMAVFDTGTTYTYLATPAYNSVMAVVDQAILYKRIASPSEAYDHCYSPPNVENVMLPTITLRFTGGAKLEILQPYAILADHTGNVIAICLTLVDSKSEYSIIGHNFMVNHSITFDRVKNKITWIQVPSCSNYRTSFGSMNRVQATWLTVSLSILSSYFLLVETHLDYTRATRYI